MSQKFHIKKNDVVVVIAGSHKGKQGKIAEREGTIHVSNLMLLSRYETSKRAKKPAAAAAKA